MLVLAGASVIHVHAEVVQIKPFSVSLVTTSSNSLGSIVSFGTAIFFSTDALMATNNPFPSLGDGLNYTHEQFYQIFDARFSDVIGISETMITDYYNGFSFNGDPPPVLSIERPFFYNIDRVLFNSLTEWSWNGDGLPLGLPLNYSPPAATGIFNQAEQRFYVSDGRQYQVVPEPSSLSLLLAGGAVLMARRRRSFK